MKGIILAGGRGTRMYPLTKSVSKQLLPVYDKPTIYYPLSTLIKSGIKDILIITNPENIDLMKDLLKDNLGLNLSFKAQENPTGGIAEAVLLAEEFLDGSDFCLILGDNILIGHDFDTTMRSVVSGGKIDGALIFGIYHDHPSQFGVLEFDQDNNVVSIEEKPSVPKSNYVVPGVYFYDNGAIDIVKTMKPSSRGELEITDLNNHYLFEGTLQARILEEFTEWFDTGNPDALIDASSQIKELQCKGCLYGFIELDSFNNGWISMDELKSSEAYKNMRTRYSHIIREALSCV